MKASRRRFLQATFGSTTLVAAGLSAPEFLVRTALAASTTRKADETVLVVVQLSGGNDGLNTVIPYADDGYGRNRTALRIADSQVLKIDDHLGLHPQLDGFQELLKDGRLAIVQGVGYPNPDRSHFRSMDIWHSAQPQIEHPRDGWLGRAVEQGRGTAGAPGHAARAGDVPALYLGPNELPLALASRRFAVPSIESVDSFRLRTGSGAVPTSTLRKMAEVERPQASPLLDFLRRSTLNAYASSEQVQEALSAGHSAVDYPAGLELAQKLKNVAQLIDAGLGTRIYYVSLGGFDTHANQMQSHANLLRELGNSVRAFLKDLAARGHLNRVLVMSFSEFGRRVKENASQGTDHGAAAPVFLAGGRVVPGLIGNHPSLTDLDQGDLKFHTDFRRLYATVLDSWLGCSSTAVLGESFAMLPILKT